MDGNPYSRMIAVIRDEGGGNASTPPGVGPCRMRLGTVTQQTPLKIAVAGITQPSSALRLDARLCKGAKWTASIKGGDVDADRAELELSEPVLKAGDQVLLLTSDDQVFYVLARVVSAT